MTHVKRQTQHLHSHWISPVKGWRNTGGGSRVMGSELTIYWAVWAGLPGQRWHKPLLITLRISDENLTLELGVGTFIGWMMKSRSTYLLYGQTRCSKMYFLCTFYSEPQENTNLPRSLWACQTLRSRILTVSNVSDRGSVWKQWIAHFWLGGGGLAAPELENVFTFDNPNQSSCLCYIVYFWSGEFRFPIVVFLFTWRKSMDQ